MLELRQIEKLIADVLAAIPAASTRQAYAKDLADFAVAFCNVSKVETALQRLLAASADEANSLVRKYRDDMDRRRDLSASAINRRLTVLRAVCKSAHRRAMIPWQLDVRNVKEESVEQEDALENDDVSAILAKAAADNSQGGRRAYAIIRLMADLGLRRAAVSSLDFDDLRMPAKLRVTLKGRSKRRWKKIPKATATALGRWLAVHPAGARRTGPVFVNLIPGRHTRLSGSAIYLIVQAAGVDVGILTHPHAFRRASITNAIVKADTIGQTADSVMQFSDHSDFRMVLRYRNRSKLAQEKFANANASTFGDPFAKAPK